MLTLLLTLFPIPAPTTVALDDVVEVENGKAALTDGSVRTGDFVVERSDAGDVTIRIVERTRKKKLRRVVLLVDAEGVVAHPVPPGLDTLPGFRFLAQDEAEGKQADAFCRYATKIADRKSPLVAALLVEALTLDPEHAPSLAALDEMTVAERLPIYRGLVEANPKNYEVEEAVRRCLPEDLRLYGRLDAPGWIHYLETAARLGVTILVDPEDPAPEWKAEKRKLGQAIHTRLWEEEDLAGYRSEHLYVISSIHDPWLVAGCLQRGENVVRAMTEMFSHVEAKRGPRYPLLVFLYSSQDEYEEKGLRVRARGSDLPHNELGGFYSGVDTTTRVYFPGGEGAVDRVTDVLAHELAHQWMHLCCPGLDATEAGSIATHTDPDRPGKWVEEGFACLVQDLVFDEEAGTFESKNPHSERLDLLANASFRVLVPWESVLRGTAADFDRLKLTEGLPVKSHLHPETFYDATQRRIYFAQVAAACGYLFNHDAESQHRLLEYLLAYYRNDTPALNVQRTLRISEAALGKQARFYAADVCRALPK